MRRAAQSSPGAARAIKLNCTAPLARSMKLRRTTPAVRSSSWSGGQGPWLMGAAFLHRGGGGGPVGRATGLDKQGRLLRREPVPLWFYELQQCPVARVLCLQGAANCFRQLIYRAPALPRCFLAEHGPCARAQQSGSQACLPSSSYRAPSRHTKAAKCRFTSSSGGGAAVLPCRAADWRAEEEWSRGWGM